MKKHDFSYEFTNLDSKIIEGSATYKRKKVSGIRVIAIAACLAILVTSIPLALIMSRSDNTEPPKTTESETTNDENNVIPPETFKVVYCDADSLEELRENSIKDKQIDYKSFKQFNYTYRLLSEHPHVGYTLDIPKTMTVVIGDKEFVGVFETVYYVKDGLEAAQDETLRSYQKIARYKIENPGHNGNAYIYYRVQSRTILDIGWINTPDESIYPNEYTRKEIEETAYNDIKSIYGDDILSQYSLKELYDYDANNLIFEFIRKIDDYDAKSSIMMNYNYKGELSHLSTNNVGVYDMFEEYMTEEELSRIEKEAMLLFENKLVCQKELFIHNDGYLCIRYRLLIDVDESGKQKTRYIYYRVE